MGNFDLKKYLAEGKLLKEGLADRAFELEMNFMDPRNKYGDEWHEKVSRVLLDKYEGKWENWVNDDSKELKSILDEFENKLLKEEEFKLYTTNVKYDNGEDGYMYQLVDAKTGEENEIGFDQLYFIGKGDASDPQVFLDKDFKDFEQTSYQDEEVSAEEAMKIYNVLK